MEWLGPVCYLCPPELGERGLRFSNSRRESIGSSTDQGGGKWRGVGADISPALTKAATRRREAARWSHHPVSAVGVLPVAFTIFIFNFEIS